MLVAIEYMATGIDVKIKKTPYTSWGTSLRRAFETEVGLSRL